MPVYIVLSFLIGVIFGHHIEFSGKSIVQLSVANPGCLSRILIFTHPGSRIPDPKIATKERGEKKIFSYLFCSHKFHKIEKYFIFEMLKKKIWASFQRIIELFIQKFVTKLLKIWVWDPGSGKPIPDPGSGSATLV